jgi:alkylation response protein AidB-like acyl-CoA dehydrogenase
VLVFPQTVDFVKNRSAFGQRVFDFQNTQFKLACVKTELAVARIDIDELLKRNVGGKVDPMKASIAKLWISELEGRILDELLRPAFERPLVWTRMIVATDKCASTGERAEREE